MTRKFVLYLILAALAVFTAFPFLWTLLVSLKTRGPIFSIPPDLSLTGLSLANYAGVWKTLPLPRYALNSLYIAAMGVGLTLIICSLAAYPLARMRFPAAGLLAISVAVAYLVPQTLLFVPMADLINRMKLGDSLSAVMLTYPTLLVPFCAWLLIGYFKTVPRELEEAALIDGASRWRAMTRVILPLCTPGFLSAGIFAFTLAQNEFLYALLFLNTSTIRTVPVGVTGELIRGDAFYWGQLMAAALLGSLPVVLIYSFFVKYYVAGLTAGSVKG